MSDDNTDENDDNDDLVGDGGGDRGGGNSYIKTNKFKPMSNNDTQHVRQQIG